MPVFSDAKHFSSATDPATAPTVRSTVQLFPATFTANRAVPAPEGVPETAKVKVDAPVASTPDCRKAVNPVTPEDAMVWAL